MVKIRQRWRNDHRHTRICGSREGMKNRYLLGAGAALAVALGGAEANAQTWSMFGWNYPVAFYVGPEGGWTQLTNQSTTVTTPAFTATSFSNTGVNQGTAGPFNSFSFNSK